MAGLTRSAKSAGAKASEVRGGIALKGDCEQVLASPRRREVQMDGRIRFWRRINVLGETRPRFLRVVTLEDCETVHNAFFDRNFRESQP
jgi:hypothetical protein